MTVLIATGPAFADTMPICGGDGPMPLPNKTHAQQDAIATNGNAQEFQVWEQSRQVVYRNQNGDVYDTRINGGDGGWKLTHAPQPLTHYPDPQERFLTTNIGAWFFDTGVHGARWIQYNTVVPEMEPLFWHGDDLYTRANTTDLSGSLLRLYRYHANDEQVTLLCDNLHFDVNDHYYLAQGHAYPYVYLYQTSKLSQGTVVRLVRINVDQISCDIEEVPNFKLLAQGNVQQLYRFEKQDAIAIKLDTAQHNLLWKKGSDGCHFFDIGDTQPLVVNRDLPVLATWAPYSPGVTLYDLRNVERQVPMTTVLENSPQPLLGIDAQALYLSADGRQLYVRPGAAWAEKGSLVRLRFNGFLSDNP